MNRESNKKLQRWINAYLDDLLDEPQRAQFRQLMDRRPALRSELELQARIDESVVRLFASPSMESSRGRVTSSAGAAAVGTRRPRKSWAASLAIVGGVAVLVLLAGGGWWFWNTLYPPAPAARVPTIRRLTLAEIYREAEQTDFKPDWVCKTDKQFICTFYWKLGHGLLLGEAPVGVQPLGLSYANAVNTGTFQIVLLTAKVNERGVIVAADNVEKDRGQTIEPGAGLHLHKRRLDHIVLYEVSPFDKPSLLGLFKETDMPQAWIDEGYSQPDSNAEG